MTTRTQNNVQVGIPQQAGVNVKRTFTVPCIGESREQEIWFNQQTRKLQDDQRALITYEKMKIGYELIKQYPSEYKFQRELCRVTGESPNIAQSAYHWVYIALKGKIDKEKKAQHMLNILLKNPQELVEFFLFGRSPYTENSLEKYWKFSRSYIVNLIHSTRRQCDSYWRKTYKNVYTTKYIKFNDTLPTITTDEVIQAIIDAYDVKTYDIANQGYAMTKSQEQFLKKLHTLVKQKELVAEQITTWINTLQEKGRWTALKELAKEIALRTKYKELLSSVRLVVVFALFDKMLETVTKLITSLPVADVVPMPFKRKRKRSPPIITMMKKDYVITREGNAEELTTKVNERMKKDLEQNITPQEIKQRRTELEEILTEKELELANAPPPMKKKYKYAPKSPLSKILRAGSYTPLGFSRGRGLRNKKGFALFPKKICEYLKNGAEIRVFQVSSNGKPNQKPRIDVILEGDIMAFHSDKLLHQYMAQLPKGNIPTLAVDINRIGEFMAQFNVPTGISKDLLKLAERWQKLKGNKGAVIPTLQRALQRAKRRKQDGKVCKLNEEIKACNKRATDLMNELTNKLSFYIGALLVNNNSKELKIEELIVDPRGKKGAIAKAIYNMPDNLTIYKKAVWLASLELGYEVKLIEVPSPYTSKIHNKCGGTILRTSGHYDYAPCKKCGEIVNTHENASLNIADRNGRQVDTFPFILPPRCT